MSIALAVMFPYVDLNAEQQQAAEVENANVGITTLDIGAGGAGAGGAVGGNVGGAAIVVDDAAINDMASDVVSPPVSVAEKVEDVVTYTNGAAYTNGAVSGATDTKSKVEETVPGADKSQEKVSSLLIEMYRISMSCILFWCMACVVVCWVVDL